MTCQQEARNQQHQPVVPMTLRRQAQEEADPRRRREIRRRKTPTSRPQLPPLDPKHDQVKVKEEEPLKEEVKDRVAEKRYKKAALRQICNQTGLNGIWAKPAKRFAARRRGLSPERFVGCTSAYGTRLPSACGTY